MAVKYRSAYLDISLPRDEISISVHILYTRPVINEKTITAITEGEGNQYSNYAKNLPSISMTVGNTPMSKNPLHIFSGSVNNKPCAVLRDTECSIKASTKDYLEIT
ncbi:hypothetical protein PoB_003301300 [Plakobranchus ocellatus]|uniref:Uncharacterized protein n=1 Tax=Plakobranchus ocellatus TaxID=259542 RepID=A0AAV4AIZ6_9GAST|nr:hypothetical protein PoB_003301300 [Plakobranchus ocellatus]